MAATVLGLALLFPGIAAAAPPSASFTFSPSAPAPGEAVTFTSTSTDIDGDIVSEQWDIGGRRAFGGSVTHAFAAAGVYRVRLTVADFFGASRSTMRTVTVGTIADFSVSPSRPLVGETVAFTSKATGDVVEQAWDLDGNGTFDRFGSRVEARYTAPRTVTITLRVTSSRGATTTASKTIEVTSSNIPPEASISVSPSSPRAGETVELRSKASDRNDDIVEESWDVNGDGQFGDATGSTAQTTFAAPGSYTVGLRVTDAQGNVVTATKTVDVAGAPAASFSFTPATPVTGEKVTFTASAADPDGTIEKLSWDLDGDGEADDAKGETATWTYKKPGSVTVALEAKDNDGLKTTTFQTVQVYEPGTVPPPPRPPAQPPAPHANASPPPPPPVSGSGPSSGRRPAGRARLLSPFPVIRIRGRIFRSSALIDILSVVAPRGATIQVRCRGRGCPRRTVTTRVRSSRRAQRVHAFERFLRAGIVLEIRVTKSGRIGKYTRFVIRGGTAPARRDLCVGPVSRRPVRCPA